MVEGARLESEYTAKPYRGFESLPLRQRPLFAVLSRLVPRPIEVVPALRLEGSGGVDGGELAMFRGQSGVEGGASLGELLGGTTAVIGVVGFFFVHL